VQFEWDDAKEQENVAKHEVNFEEARQAFKDPHRITLADLAHSADEPRLLCLARVKKRILSVRYTRRADDTVRIIGAGYWRKGAKLYEKEVQIH
jgi:uncharacterized protein